MGGNDCSSRDPGKGKAFPSMEFFHGVNIRLGTLASSLLFRCWRSGNNKQLVSPLAAVVQKQHCRPSGLGYTGSLHRHMCCHLEKQRDY